MARNENLMSAEDYLPDCWEIELYEAYSSEFLSNPEPKNRRKEEEMSFQYEEILCPDCSSKMISRTGKFGIFWGCKNYPECKGTRDSQGRSKADRAKEQGLSHEEDFKDEFNRFSFKRTR